MDVVKMEEEDYLKNRFLQTRYFFKRNTKDDPRFHESLPYQNVFSLVAVNIPCQETNMGLTSRFSNKLEKRRNILTWYNRVHNMRLY